MDAAGYSVAETAQMLGIAEGTVRARAAGGRNKLAALLRHVRNCDVAPTEPPHPDPAKDTDR